jgi:hypothetical protein
MAAEPGVTETVNTLVCDGKTLRGSIDETASGAARFIAQVSLYSNSLGVANCFAEDARIDVNPPGSQICRCREGAAASS